MNSNARLTLSSKDDKYNVNHYYHRQADFEQEGDEEISSEDQIRLFMWLVKTG